MIPFSKYSRILVYMGIVYCIGEENVVDRQLMKTCTKPKVTLFILKLSSN